MTTIALQHHWTVSSFEGPFAAVMEGRAEQRRVSVPHDALRDAPRSPDARGGGAGAYFGAGAFTYRRTLSVPEEWRGQTLQLEIEGAQRRAQVFVNNELAGNRADGYARFFVDITPFVHFGEDNEVRIEVRSAEDSRWYAGAGLHRAVNLHVDPLAHVVPDGVAITTLDVADGIAQIEVATTARNTGPYTVVEDLHVEIESPAGEGLDAATTPVTLAPGVTTTLRQRFLVKHASLWSPDTPALYEARVTLGEAGSRNVAFGIRTVAVDPQRGLRINGHTVLMRGACIHHDNGPLGGAALTRAEERRVELLKMAGFNAIRAAHNPLSNAMLDACDRLGMLVIDEAFDMWTRGKKPFDYSHDFPQWWRDDLTAMVRKDLNHPSVVMYSIGNEIAEVGSPHGAALTREMANHVRALDPTRPTTNAVNIALGIMDELESMRDTAKGLNEMLADDENVFDTPTGVETGQRRLAESSAAVDVLGLNYAETRYQWDLERFPHRVVVGSETFPAFIGRLWPLVEKYSHVIGDFTWTGWDYLGEVGIGATTYEEDGDVMSGLERAYPYLTAWCGDIDLTGWRRPVSYYREIVFGLRTEPYIAVLRPERTHHTIVQQTPWAWSDSVSSWTWRGYESTPVKLEVYADADEVALLLDGAEIGRAEVGARVARLADFEVEYRPGRLTAVALRGGTEVGRTELSTASGAALTLDVDRTALRAHVRDLSYIAIELRDEAGTLVVDADRNVAVEVSGPGRLAGMCSANPCTEERFDAKTWTTFDGRALAVVEAEGPGLIEVVVTSDGLTPARTSLEAR